MSTVTLTPSTDLSIAPLFEPINLGAIALPNRIIMAPLTRARSGESRIPNGLMLEHYVQRASAGLIITEATQISEQGAGWAQTPGIHTPEQAAILILEKNGDLVLYKHRELRLIRNNFGLNHEIIEVSGDKI